MILLDSWLSSGTTNPEYEILFASDINTASQVVMGGTKERFIAVELTVLVRERPSSSQVHFEL